MLRCQGADTGESKRKVLKSGTQQINFPYFMVLGKPLVVKMEGWKQWKPSNHHSEIDSIWGTRGFILQTAPLVSQRAIQISTLWRIQMIFFRSFLLISISHFFHHGRPAPEPAPGPSPHPHIPSWCVDQFSGREKFNSTPWQPELQR